MSIKASFKALFYCQDVLQSHLANGLLFSFNYISIKNKQIMIKKQTYCEILLIKIVRFNSRFDTNVGLHRFSLSLRLKKLCDFFCEQIDKFRNMLFIKRDKFYLPYIKGVLCQVKRSAKLSNSLN